MRDLRQALAEGGLLGDGAMGTLLSGSVPGVALEALPAEAPERVEAAHLAYLTAGSDLVQTHTFGANRVRLERLGLGHGFAAIHRGAARAARRAREVSGRPAFILGNLGPTGLRGDELTAKESVAGVFQESAEALVDGGVDGIIVETLSDPRELEAAIRGVRRATDLPLLVTFSLSVDGVSRDGATIEDMVAALAAPGARLPDAFGLNCGAGPAPLMELVPALQAALARRGLKLPLVVQPNAGLPTRREGRITYPASPQYMASHVPHWIQAGVALVGGCCGTDAETIAAMRLALAGRDGPRASDVRPPGPAARPRAAVRAPGPGLWISVEVDPPKGPLPERMLEEARAAAEAGADAVNVADSPMARVRMGSLASAVLIREAVGIDTLLHFTTRDRNLMGIQADLLGAHALGVRSILALTGDPPGLGDYARATAVYDLDSVGLIRLLRGMNEGVDANLKPLGARTEFVIRAGCDPGQEPLVDAVRRSRAKIEAGAQALLTQPVYDPRVFLRFLEALEPTVPVICGIMPLISGRQADYLHHEVPGIQIPEAVRRQLHEAGAEAGALGEALADEVLEALRPHVAGVYVIPSLGRMEVPLRLVRAWRRRYGPGNGETSGEAS